MRLLLDENFPKPLNFPIDLIDGTVEVVHLNEFNRDLAGAKTPDWYLYLEAHKGGYDALVTRDKRQASQNEELWVLSKIQLSVITWSKPINDPICLWGQLIAYMPRIQKLIQDNGSSIVFLPAIRLDTGNAKKATSLLGEKAKNSSISRQQAREQAQSNVVKDLKLMGKEGRFPDIEG